MSIERTAYDRVRIGEDVAPSLLSLLDYLKVKDVFLADQQLPVVSTTAAWGSESLRSRDSLFTPFGESLQLDRERFDQLLAEQVDHKGGTVYPRTKYTACEQLANGGWRVFLSHRSGETFSIKTQLLVDASGRQAHVIRQKGVF